MFLTTPVTAAATTATTPPAPAPVIAAAAVDLSSLMQDLSFASIAEIPDEIACAINLPFMTILDSGTTVMLVKERCYFHTYSTADPINILTTNHGVLQTTGCGSCIAWLTIGKQCLHIHLSNCLHAPNALLNLLSVSCMNAKGWDINFRSNMTCELGYKGSLPSSIPATGKLYAPNLEFIPSSDVPPIMAPSTELSTFVDIPLTQFVAHLDRSHRL